MSDKYVQTNSDKLFVKIEVRTFNSLFMFSDNYSEKATKNVKKSPVSQRVPCKVHVIITGIACIPAIPVIFEVNTLCGLLIYTLN